MCAGTCNDDRFKIIGKAKEDLLKSTNIDSDPDEMKVLDVFLFRCGQMGWLNQYKEGNSTDEIMKLRDKLSDLTVRYECLKELNRTLMTELERNYEDK